jgi:hypothetical protein
MTPYNEEQSNRTKDMTLQEIAAAVIQKHGCCASCGEPLDLNDIKTYDHEGGIAVKGYDKKQWVYFHCKKCDYDSALWKIENGIKWREMRE